MKKIKITVPLNIPLGSPTFLSLTFFKTKNSKKRESRGTHSDSVRVCGLSHSSLLAFFRERKLLWPTVSEWRWWTPPARTLRLRGGKSSLLQRQCFIVVVIISSAILAVSSSFVVPRVPAPTSSTRRLPLAAPAMSSTTSFSSPRRFWIWR